MKSAVLLWLLFLSVIGSGFGVGVAGLSRSSRSLLVALVVVSGDRDPRYESPSSLLGSYCDGGGKCAALPDSAGV